MTVTRDAELGEVGRPQNGAPGGAFDGEWIAAAVVFLALAAVPAVVSGYPVYILPQYMLFGMLALSLGLLWGFIGIVSFGQAAFFALGAYTMAPCSDRRAREPGLRRAARSVVPRRAAGWLAISLRAGVRGAYFVIVTLALSIIVEQLAVSQSQITGGWNGMFIDRMSLTFGPLGEVSLFDDAPIYYVVLVGRRGDLRAGQRPEPGAVRQAAGRHPRERGPADCGVRTPLYKTAARALRRDRLLAGALYGTHANFVAPSLAGVLFSTEVVVWVAIGGRGSLLGAARRHPRGFVSNYLSAIVPATRRLRCPSSQIVYLRGGVAGAIAACSRAALGLSRMAELLRTEADQAISGPGRQRPRRFPAREQRAALHHRAERRRQDHLHQHDLGPPQAERRRHLVPGRAHHPAARGRPRQRASAASSRRRCSTTCRCSRTSSWPRSPPRGAGRQSAHRPRAAAGPARAPAGVLARISRTVSASGWRSGFARERGQASAARRAHRGHDRRGNSATGELIRQLVAELQVAAIIIEHDINFIRSLRAPITVMHLGRVLVEGAFEEIERNVQVREVYLGALRRPRSAPSRRLRPMLREVSMRVGSGEVLGVLGRNGMGKSTLIRCLSGLIRPDAGRIVFAGRDVTALAAHERARLGMTTVVQGRGMFPLTVCESLEMGRIASGRARRSRIDEVLDYFPA